MSSRVLPGPDEAIALAPAPGSITWRLFGDPRLTPGAGFTLLLQVAHPTVGLGVAEHSGFVDDPWGRLLRTLDYVNGTIYGGPELAAEMGRRVRLMHRAIRGTTPQGERYHALEPGAFAWVHVTLAVAAIRLHAVLGQRVAPAEREVFWREWVGVGRLIGVRERDLPSDWSGVERLYGHMCQDVLVDQPSVHDVLRTLQRPAPPPGVPRALWPPVRAGISVPMWLMTIGLLPPVLRERFGVRWLPAQELVFRGVCAASRASGPILPAPLHQLGPRYLQLRGHRLRPGASA